MFGLDGKYTWREGPELAGAGWWREARAIPMDFTTGKADVWLANLSAD